MKLKNCVVFFLFTFLLVNLTFASNITWSHVWDANDLPEDFDGGNVFNGITHVADGETITREILTGAKYRCVTGGSTASGSNASYETKEFVFDCSTPSTIEWRFKNITAPYYTNAMLIKQAGVGYVGFKFVWNHGCNPYEVNSYVQIYADASYWSTIRILVYTVGGVLDSADLFYKNADDEWVYGNTSTLTSSPSTAKDTIQIGDIGSNWGGEWQEEYMMFANDVATLDELLSPDIDVADINADGIVDVDDLDIFVSEWLSN